MSARDVISHILHELSVPEAHAKTSLIMFAMEDAGYRILGLGELDSETLESAAKKADEYVWDDHALEQSTDVGRACHFQSREIAEAIRSLRSAG